MSIVSIYIDDFLSVSNMIKNLDKLKVAFLNVYNVKVLDRVKTIIRWQIIRDFVTQIMKIDQSAFIWDLVIEENLSNCNANVVLMKAESAINMSNVDAFKEKNLHSYQQLIDEQMYLLYKIKPDIAFAIS